MIPWPSRPILTTSSKKQRARYPDGKEDLPAELCLIAMAFVAPTEPWSLTSALLLADPSLVIVPDDDREHRESY